MIQLDGICSATLGLGHMHLSDPAMDDRAILLVGACS